MPCYLPGTVAALTGSPGLPGPTTEPATQSVCLTPVQYHVVSQPIRIKSHLSNNKKINYDGYAGYFLFELWTTSDQNPHDTYKDFKNCAIN